MEEMVSAGVRRPRVGVKGLVGAGDRIGTSMLPLVAASIALGFLCPELIRVSSLPRGMVIATTVFLAAGVIAWAWSVALILIKVPKGALITSGPFAVVKHPLYTAVALLVLPWGGLLLGTWLGIALGLSLYVAARLFAPAEERALSAQFGARWDAYELKVMVPWL